MRAFTALTYAYKCASIFFYFLLLASLKRKNRRHTRRMEVSLTDGTLLLELMSPLDTGTAPGTTVGMSTVTDMSSVPTLH